MKRNILKLLGISMLFLLTINVQNVDASWRHRHRRGGQCPTETYRPPRDQTGFATPLDGGLLALLAGGGIAYFASRKKRKNQQL